MSLIRHTTMARVSVPLFTTLALLSLISPTYATAYAPAVKAGDWAKYNVQLTVQGNKTLLAGTLGFFQQFNNTKYAMLNVTSVSGTNVTTIISFHYNNGTVYNLPSSMNQPVNVTATNTSGGPIIAGGLTAPDPIGLGNSAKLNSTKTLTILSVSRGVNFLNTTMSFNNGGYSGSSSNGWAWDQATGIFVGLSFSGTATQNGSTGSYSVNLAISDTNLWSAPTVLGVSQTTFYLIVGVIAAVVVVGAVLAVWKLRKPKAVPQVSPSSQPSSPAKP